MILLHIIKDDKNSKRKDKIMRNYVIFQVIQ